MLDPKESGLSPMYYTTFDEQPPGDTVDGMEVRYIIDEHGNEQAVFPDMPEYYGYEFEED